jgi:hypothetical protein
MKFDVWSIERYVHLLLAAKKAGGTEPVFSGWTFVLPAVEACPSNVGHVYGMIDGYGAVPNVFVGSEAISVGNQTSMRYLEYKMSVPPPKTREQMSLKCILIDNSEFEIPFIRGGESFVMIRFLDHAFQVKTKMHLSSGTTH